MKSSKPFIIGIGIIVVIAAAVAFLRKPVTELAAPEVAKPIQVGTRSVADSRSSVLALTFPGTIAQDGISTLFAKTAGTVISSNIRLGQKVGIGTVLARIDDPSGTVVSKSGFNSADIRAAELDVERAKLSYTEAKRVDSGTSTHANELSKDLAKKNLEAAEAGLAARIDTHVVKSPIAGIITDRSISAGDSVSPGTALFVVDSGKAARTVTFYVNESERALLVPGQKLSIFRSANDTEPVDATLKRVSSVADPASRRFLAEASVSDPTSVLPGTSVSVSAEAKLVSSVSGRLFLPLSAITVESSGSSSVFQVDGTTAKRVPVDIVRIEGEIAEISVSLSDDTRLVIENAKRIKDGDTVEASSE
jgi:membrane fusion protein, multidrug efflux system